eukprot:6187905-Pleurochrysis_carterae.AAC.1
MRGSEDDGRRGSEGAVVRGGGGGVPQVGGREGEIRAGKRSGLSEAEEGAGGVQQGRGRQQAYSSREQGRKGLRVRRWVGLHVSSL